MTRAELILLAILNVVCCVGIMACYIVNRIKSKRMIKAIRWYEAALTRVANRYGYDEVKELVNKNDEE